MREQSGEDLDLTDPAGYRHWTTVTIRYRDLDPLGHINNSVYSEWFEAARVHADPQVQRRRARLADRPRSRA